MELQEVLKMFLAENDFSGRQLSIQAGLNPKAVSDILNRKGHRPRRATLERLSVATGIDLVGLPGQGAATFRTLISSLEEKAIAPAQATTAKRQLQRVRWYLNQKGTSADVEPVCRHDIIDFFGTRTAAELGLSKSSMASYKSELLKAVDQHHIRARERNAMDLVGELRDLKDALCKSALPKDLVNSSGAFLLYLQDQQIDLRAISQDTLRDYFDQRMAAGNKTEDAVIKHVKRIANLTAKLASDPAFARFGCPYVAHPFDDGRQRFGVSDEEIQDFMEHYMQAIEPWAKGQASRDGQDRDAFLAALDAEEAQQRAVLRKRQRSKRTKRSAQAEETEKQSRVQKHEEQLRRYGFLTQKAAWSTKTAANRRGYMSSLVKAHFAATKELITSFEDLLDLDLLEDAIISLKEANGDAAYDSGYIGSVTKAIGKIAVGFYQIDAEGAERIRKIGATYSVSHQGMAPRNKEKLRQFTDTRIVKMIDLTDTIICGVNQEITELRKVQKTKTGVLPKPADVCSPNMACQVMAALAHGIMLKRAPRSSNLISIRLDWIRWQGDHATIDIPSEQVKSRDRNGADLVIPLGADLSKLLRTYIEHIRSEALLPGDEENPYLFPGQDRRRNTLGQPYRGLLQRTCKLVHREVGVRMHPHLYRHLIGWIWLKDSLDHLPKVSKMLGHKTLQTTIDYYAEVDEALALNEWQTYQESIRSNAKQAMRRPAS